MPAIEAEKLLRIALFSDTLRLSEGPQVLSQTGLSDLDGMPKPELVERRTSLAQSLREYRRKGVVPVFFSFMWFFFALAISIVSTLPVKAVAQALQFVRYGRAFWQCKY